MTKWASSQKFVQHMKINWSHHINRTTESHMINSTDAEKKPLTNLACFHNKTSKSLGIKMNILHITREYIYLKNTANSMIKDWKLPLPPHPYIRNKARTPAHTSSIQHCIRGPSRAIMKKKIKGAQIKRKK